MKSLILHYMNKYPGGRVQAGETALDVYDADNRHRVALRAQGSGQLVCHSEAFGCSDRHDLAPIPKDARLYKEVDGKIVKDNEFETRESKLGAFAQDGRIPSCHELGAGFFDEKQRLTESGVKRFFAPKAPEAPQAPQDPSTPQA